jgi:Flp pilus assembly pilin Flp
MSKWINRVKRFLVSEDGPMAVEYAILLWQVVLVNT